MRIAGARLDRACLNRQLRLCFLSEIPRRQWRTWRVSPPTRRQASVFNRSTPIRKPGRKSQSLILPAQGGFFSDRTITEYAGAICNAKPCPVLLRSSRLSIKKVTRKSGARPSFNAFFAVTWSKFYAMLKHQFRRDWGRGGCRGAFPRYGCHQIFWACMHHARV